MSIQIKVHDHNPDPKFNGCRALNRNERGVVFDNIEPLVGSTTFVGETAIYEAFAKLHGYNVRTLRQIMAGGTEKQKERIAELEAEVKKCREDVESVYRLAADFGQELVTQFQYIDDPKDSDS